MEVWDHFEIRFSLSILLQSLRLKAGACEAHSQEFRFHSYLEDLALKQDCPSDLNHQQQTAETSFPAHRKHQLLGLETLEVVTWRAFVWLDFVLGGRNLSAAETAAVLHQVRFHLVSSSRLVASA
jgi:hypothetical protein